MEPWKPLFGAGSVDLHISILVLMRLYSNTSLAAVLYQMLKQMPSLAGFLFLS